MTRPAAPSAADLERDYRGLAAQLASIGYIRAGSLALRDNICGRPGCRCKADPPKPHGPYWQWTAKVAGKTVNRRLTPAQADLYRRCIDNDRRLRAVVQQMRDVAAQAIELQLTQAAEV